MANIQCQFAPAALETPHRSYAAGVVFRAAISYSGLEEDGCIGGAKQSVAKILSKPREGSVLKSIDPILNADVLYALRAMGHGDDLVICDTNFPADATARQTILGRLLRIDNVTAGRAARAILSVLPLDFFVDKPALRMEIVGKPDEIPPVQAEVQTEIDAAQGHPLPMGSIERFAFYELAKKSYCVIQTGERRFYGCFIFKKGVIASDAA
jgi:L-fucose mutarotase